MAGASGTQSTPRLCAWHGSNRADLLNQLQAALQGIGGDAHSLAEVSDQSLAQAFQQHASMGSERLALVAETTEQLRTRLERAIIRLERPETQFVRDSTGCYHEATPLAAQGQVAWLFPGEGAQYLGMLSGLLPHLPEVRQVVEQANTTPLPQSDGSWQAAGLGRYFLPTPQDKQLAADLEQNLKQLDVAMYTVLLADFALENALRSLGMQPDLTAGHSMGEIAALAAAQALVGLPDLARMVQTLSAVQGAYTGRSFALLALGTSAQTAQDLIATSHALGQGFVHVAMDNCPHQVVVVGDRAAVAQVDAAAHARNLMREQLPLAGPYHTPLFKQHAAPLFEMVDRMPFARATCPVYSSTTAAPFPEDLAEVKALAHAHWFSTVEFTRTIRNMHAAGARVFIEVGPRGNLTGFVQDILRGESVAAIPLDVPRRPSWTQFLHALGQMYVHQVPAAWNHWLPRLTTVAAPESRDDAHSALPIPVSHGAPLQTPSRANILAGHLALMDQFLVAERELTLACLQRGRKGWAARPEFSEIALEPPQIEAAAFPVETSRVSNTSAGNPHFPLIDLVVEHLPGERLVVRKTLSLANDLYASEHTVGGREVSAVQPDQHGLPVVPMTFSLELMAEVAELLYPDLKAVRLSDVCLYRWLAVYDTPGEIEVTAVLRKAKTPAGAAHVAEASPPIEGSLVESSPCVEITIRDLRVQATAGDGITSRGVVSLSRDYPAPPTARPVLTDAEPCGLPLHTLYNNLFHGPLFQGVVSLDSISSQGITATVQVPPRDQVLTNCPAPQFRLDPVLLDIILHPMAGWHLCQADQSGRILLPYEVARLDLFGPPPRPGERLHSLGTLTQGTHRRFSHQALACYEDGTPWCQLTDVKCWRFYLPFGEVNFHGPKNRYFLSESLTNLTKSLAAEGASAHAAFVACRKLHPPEDLAQSALQEAGACVMLTPRENQAFAELPTHPVERGKWLFTFATAKDAVREWFTASTADQLYMADLQLEPVTAAVSSGDQTHPVTYWAALLRGDPGAGPLALVSVATSENASHATANAKKLPPLIVAAAAEHALPGLAVLTQDDPLVEPAFAPGAAENWQTLARHAGLTPEMARAQLLAILRLCTSGEITHRVAGWVPFSPQAWQVYEICVDAPAAPSAPCAATWSFTPIQKTAATALSDHLRSGALNVHVKSYQVDRFWVAVAVPAWEPGHSTTTIASLQGARR